MKLNTLFFISTLSIFLSNYIQSGYFISHIGLITSHNIYNNHISTQQQNQNIVNKNFAKRKNIT